MTQMSAIQQLLGQAPPASASQSATLDQQDFLRLMITQLQNQDPFKPMENGDFLGQMAQFSTVSGIQQLNDTFGSASATMQSSQALQAASLVERDVLVRADTAHLPAEGDVRGAVAVPPGASEAVVTIADASGSLVARIPAEVGADGRARFTWDGRNGDGNRLAAGEYRIEALTQVGGETQSAETLVWNRVDSVSLTGRGNAISLNLVGGGTVSLRDAIEIS
jgi:flagellar basal-body rod modification protein FlgD